MSSLILAWTSVLAGCVGGLEDAPSFDPNAGQGYVPEEQAEAIAPAPTLHRLNGLEYNNTVRDLTGTTLKPADNFPPDPTANGFDNMADQLGITANQLSAYFTAAHDVIEDALDDRPLLRVDVTPADLEKSGGYPVGALWALSGTSASTQFEVQRAGPHHIEFELGAAIVGPAPAPTVELRVDDRILETAQVAGTGADPQTRSFDIELETGTHVLSVHPTNFVNMAAENTANNVFIRAIRAWSSEIVHGPGRARIIVCEPLSAHDCYRTIIERFATRAWRRPVPRDTLETLVSLGQALVSSGEQLEDSLKLVLRSIMTSPRFFFRARTADDDNTAGRVDPYVLASRLSYFLWSSMPDDALLEAAENGSLGTDEGVVEQVRRMLADDKAKALMLSFAAQWLSVREFERASPDTTQYPSFTPDVQAAMAQESLHFFFDYLDNDLPVTSMLAPNFGYRNDALSAHYQETELGSNTLARVPLAAEQRRGVMALGAWLVARSTATHASPIRRGAWVSEHVLCQPVEPPPAGLEIPDLDFGSEEMSIREQLERHRSDPRCATCHARLDVVGMGFQLFDAAGIQGRDPSQDSLGELQDGSTFRGAREFADQNTARQRFAACIVEKLTTYALGRGVHGKDLPFIEDLAKRLGTETLTLPQLIAEVSLFPSFVAATSLEVRP